MLLVSLVILFLSAVASGAAGGESFHEELLLKRLPSLHMLANFRFKSRKSSDLGNHYNLFPKVIGELIQIYDLDELHLSLTQGFWRHNSWGYQPQPATPVGAQVWAWFTRNTTNVDEKWKNLIHSLSGLFCASLSQLEPTLTVSPEFSFRPSGVISGQPDNSRLKYGVLPTENVCTENLTPWKKLLPCNENENKCQNHQWEVTQTMTSVFDAAVVSKTLNWSLKDYFGYPIRKACALAETSDVFFQFGNNVNPAFHPEPTEIISDTSNTGLLKLARFDLKKLFTGNNLNIGATYSEPGKFLSIPSCGLSLHSYVGGTGLQNGKLISRLENREPADQKLIFMQMIPWFLRTYFHTLQIACAPLDGRKKETKQLNPLFEEIKLGKDRLRPYFLEVGLSLPRKSECFVEIEFEKSLLRWTEYPPDAHHGFPVPATVVTFKSPNRDNMTLPGGRSSLVSESLNSKEDSWVVQLFGEVRLVNLPTPDFSMPYNVICLVCTVVALAFGPIHNMTTRSLVLKDPDELKKEGLKMKIRNFVAKIFQKFRKSKKVETTDSAHEKKE